MGRSDELTDTGKKQRQKRRKRKPPLGVKGAEKRLAPRQ